MDLRTFLERDFGSQLEIAGGYGQSQGDPIIVLNSNPIDASVTEMHVLRAIGKGRGMLWRTIARTSVEDSQRSLERIQIETMEVTESEVITQRENYYFDVSMAVAPGAHLPTVIAFSDGRTKLVLPYELGWIHFDGITVYEPASAGLGQAISYGAPGIKATIYVYDMNRTDIPFAIDESVALNEFEAAVSELTEVHPTAAQLHEFTRYKRLLIQTFRIDDCLTILALGIFRGKFVKLRLTHTDDPILVNVVLQSIEAFQDVIAANPQQGIH